MVAPRSRIFVSDEELGKRDDDRKPSKMGSLNLAHRPTWRKRRIFLAILACIGVWAFIHYIPTDLGPMDRRTGMRLPPPSSRRAFPSPDPHNPQQPPQSAAGSAASDPSAPHSNSHAEEDDDEDDVPRHDYEGPVRFYYLASTLRSAHAAGGSDAGNKHVLFAASDLNAAAALVPIACQMAAWRRNFVHIALMGRSDLPIDKIREINGVSPDSCTVFWHDARPDFGLTSTAHRMEISVAGAMHHINSFIHPGVVITTDVDSEDLFFGRGLQRKLPQIGVIHIQIPKTRPQSLAWMSRLDASSLKAWHSARIDVLIQAPLDSSGSLIRLLKSLAQADYAGFNPPRLTIELPPKIDLATQSFLSRFRWPPSSYSPSEENEQITIRRRIVEQRASVDEATLRFIESFYPSGPQGPHVLLLSPQAELSPLYFHYLKLHLLEYLYAAGVGAEQSNLIGISLESPSTLIDGLKPFPEPQSSTKSSSSGPEEQDHLPFRWQAPNSNAALYFASKWLEIHSFFMKRHAAARQPSLQQHFTSQSKLVSQKYPAWMEYILQLMKTRGTTMHYPGVHRSQSDSSSDALVIVHNELYQVPEEFAQPDQDSTEADSQPSPDDVLTIKDDYLDSHHPNGHQQKALNTESSLLRNLDNILPKAPSAATSENSLDGAIINDGRANNDMDEFRLHSSTTTPALPRLSTLPLLDYMGNELSFADLLEHARAARMGFRATAGGCSDQQSKTKQVLVSSATDLFCFDDDPDAQLEPVPPPMPPPEPPPPIISTPGVEADHDDDYDDDYNDDGAPDKTDTSGPPGDGDFLSAPQTPQDGTIPKASEPDNINPPAASPQSPLPVTVDDVKLVEQPVAAAMPPPNPQGNEQPPSPQDPDPAPAPAPAPAENQQDTPISTPNEGPAVKLETPPSSNSEADGKPAFPIIDPSTIKAFDEGREAERDVPTPDSKR